MDQTQFNLEPTRQLHQNDQNPQQDDSCKMMRAVTVFLEETSDCTYVQANLSGDCLKQIRAEPLKIQHSVAQLLCTRIKSRTNRQSFGAPYMVAVL